MTAVEKTPAMQESSAAAAARQRRELLARQRQAAEAGGVRPNPAALHAAVLLDTPDVIRTVGGYISLPYAAELFGVDRGRLNQAAWRGLLPAVKSDITRTAPWMTTLKDVARYLMDYPVQRRGGRPRGAPNKTPEVLQAEADLHAEARARYSPWHPSQQRAAARAEARQAQAAAGE